MRNGGYEVLVGKHWPSFGTDFGDRFKEKGTGYAKIFSVDCFFLVI